MYRWPTKTKPVHEFVGDNCSIGASTQGTHTADYLVVDGDIRVLACARHLLDAIEQEVTEQGLTVDCDPLEVYRLRDEEND